MSLDTLTFNGAAPVNWSASKNVTGASPNTNASSANEAKAALGTSAAGNAANGANELYFAILSIAPSGSATIDFTSLTDILAAAGVAAARLKFVQVEALSVAQDSVNGTNATSITIDNTVTNALSAQGHSGWFDNGAEGAAGGSKFTLPNGAWLQFGMTNANGVTVDATHKVIKITNNDGTNAAAVKLVAVPSTV